MRLSNYLNERIRIPKDIQQPKTWRDLGRLVNEFLVDSGLKISSSDAKEIAKQLGISTADVKRSFDAFMWDSKIDKSKSVPKINLRRT